MGKYRVTPVSIIQRQVGGVSTWGTDGWRIFGCMSIPQDTRFEQLADAEAALKAINITKYRISYAGD
jgi:hypothetical protein